MQNALYETSGGTKLIDPDFVLAELDVQPGQRVGDLGAGGGGHFTFPLARWVGRGGMVYAVDVVPDTLAVIERRARLEGIANIQTIHSNLEIIGATSIPSETLDRAVCINVLFQNVHHDHILKEAHRLLKANGKLLVIDWKPSTLAVGPPAARRVSTEMVTKIASDVGFEAGQVFAASPWHYGMILNKKS